MHFGSCKFPLNLLMLQNEHSKIVLQQFDIVETQNETFVGCLQLVLTNTCTSQALPVTDNALHKTYSAGAKVKKITVSHQIDKNLKI